MSDPTAAAPAMADRLAAFVVDGAPPAEARRVAATAVLDTLGVALAGAGEPVARLVQGRAVAESRGEATVFGTAVRASAADAALCNGVAAHALDFDDMCFVSLAHPSAPLVPALFAAGELAHASGRAVLEAYVIAFEIEARFGAAMNPRHYQRGWHCTSTLGTIGAAAGACRVLGLDRTATAHALAASVSMAAGLKANFGTMVKPLHAGLAARAGLVAARLAQDGLTASADAIDGPQGFLHAMDGEERSLAAAVADLGSRWEAIESGVTVKLYPSCAGTHPTIDAIRDLRDQAGFSGDDVEAIDIGVDAVTPTILIYPRPETDLEAKFSLPFCAAAAALWGRVGVDTFEEAPRADPRLQRLMARVTMRVDDTLDPSAPALTQATVRLRLRDGREFVTRANGARGYPAHPASAVELREKFASCAARVLPAEAVARAYEAALAIDRASDVRDLTRLLRPESGSAVAPPPARGRASRSETSA